MRKRALCAIASVAMIAGAMMGCGNDITKQGGVNTEISDVNVNNQNTEAVAAYKKFYSDFYDKHLSNDDNLKEADCAAKLVMDANGNLLLAITDMQSMDKKGDILLDLYIYEYKNNEVAQKVKIPNIKSYDDGMGIATAGDNLLVWTDYSGGDTVFTVNGSEYEEIKHAGIDSEGDTVKTGLGEYKTDAGLLARSGSLVNLFFSDSGNPFKFCVHGQDFEDWLDYYSNNQVTSSLKLDILYADYLEKNRYYELKSGQHLNQYIIYWKDGIYYRYIPAGDSYDDITAKEDSLYIMSGEFKPYIDSTYLNEKTLENIPDNIDGIKVVVTDKCKDLISQNVNKSVWKQSYINYFKDKSQNVIYTKLVKLDGLDAPLLFYITSEKTYKLFYIDGSGNVQELLNTSEHVSGCSKYNNSSAISISMSSGEYKYKYDKSTGKFIKVDKIEASGRDDHCWFDGIYEKKEVSSDWLIDELADY